MKKYFRELEELFQNPKSILTYIDKIEALRAKIIEPELITEFVNKVREKVQDEAKQAVIKNGGTGMIAMATGSGKSRVAVELAKYYLNSIDKSLALIVPTEKLRDENWKEEYQKWGAEYLWTPTVRLCYASASKIQNKNLELAILDEGHNITELSSEFFLNNEVERAVLLTATPPEDKVKRQILSDLDLPLVYELTLDQAVRLGFVAPYKITVITVPLDATTKNIPGGTKANPFMTTEAACYAYWNKRVQGAMFDQTPQGKAKLKFAILGRMQFIYKIPSKTQVIKYLLDKVIPQDDRTIIFCGNIEQAEDVCSTYYHSKSGNQFYDAFKTEQINRLSCVKAVNEGHNFPGVDSAIIGQLNSKEKDLVQRIGRIIRYRPGHEAHIWIVISESTQDEKWLENATENLNQSKINYVRFPQFKQRTERSDSFKDMPNANENLEIFRKHGVESIQIGKTNYKI
jgi:superfamily II DNA or RNA helicase